MDGSKAGGACARDTKKFSWTLANAFSNASCPGQAEQRGARPDPAQNPRSAVVSVGWAKRRRRAPTQAGNAWASRGEAHPTALASAGERIHYTPRVPGKRSATRDPSTKPAQRRGERRVGEAPKARAHARKEKTWASRGEAHPTIDIRMIEIGRVGDAPKARAHASRRRGLRAAKPTLQRVNHSVRGQRRRLYVLAAVDMDLGAGDVGRGFRAQHVDDLGHFVGRAEPVQRNLLDDLVRPG